jgi:hypothetical protein
MPYVYTLEHEYEPRPGVDEAKLIGIYSTRELAEQAKARVRDKPGFQDHPEDFLISEVLLDRDGWTEGFGPA